MKNAEQVGCKTSDKKTFANGDDVVEGLFIRGYKIQSSPAFFISDFWKLFLYIKHSVFLLTRI